VPHDLGESENCQPVEVRQQLDAGSSHATSPEAAQSQIRDPTLQLARQLGAVKIARLFAC
jgi:hypothetical protein